MPVPTTREGYEKLRADIEDIELVQIPKVRKLVAEARAEGDLRENAEYHGQRENLGMLEGRLAMLQAKLADSYIVEKGTGPAGVVVFGTRVTVKDLGADIDEVYEFVGPGEEDYSGEVMKILTTSPFAQQLLNRSIGETVEVTTPGGTIKYKIIAVE